MHGTNTTQKDASHFKQPYFKLLANTSTHGSIRFNPWKKGMSV